MHNPSVQTNICQQRQGQQKLTWDIIHTKVQAVLSFSGFASITAQNVQVDQGNDYL